MARKRVSRRRPRLQVWKFGGASLADAAAVRNAVVARPRATRVRSWSWSQPSRA